MSKTRKIDVRVSDEEMLEIERICRGLKISKSDYMRAVAFGGSIAKPQSASPSPTAPTATFDEERIAAIESELREIRAELAASAHAFDALLQKIAELIRVPTFREYRSRVVAEGDDKRAGEDDLAFLIRIAKQYFLLYQIWPDPADLRSFGGVPQGVDLARFPKSPQK